jgi:hypothetical protein
MSADVFDRLLEHVLRDELAPAAPLPTAELATRIAAALAGRSARRAAVLTSPATAARRAGGRARRRWLPYAIAGAAGVAVALTWLAAQPSGLTCSRAVLLATTADQPFTAGTHVAAPSFAWCIGDVPVELTGPDGTAASAAPGTAFVIDPQRRSARLLAGALELRGRAAPWRIDADGVGEVAIVVADGCAVRCILTPEASPPTDPTDPTMTPNALRARLRDLAAPATLTVLVLAGTAELLTAQGPAVLPAGSSRTIDAGAERTAVARARELYEQVRKELPPANDEASTVARKDLDERFHELIGLALQQPAVVTALRPAIAQDLAGGRLGAEPCARAVQLALLDEEPRMFSLATRAWEQHPERFGLEEQIALTERGFAPARGKLRESLAQMRGVQVGRVYAALAAGGDESARPALGRFLRADVADAGRDIQRFDARCYAAAASQQLGDAAPMRELRTALVAQVETWVASGDPQQLALADSCLQRGEYWLGSQQPRLSWPDVRVRAASPQRGTPDAASLRARATALAAK